MTTTITTGLLAGTTGLAGLGGLAAAGAIAGAVGLGALGLAAASRNRGRRGGRRRGNRHRGRRSLDAEGDDFLRRQNALELVRTEDVTTCGRRLVCELAALEEEEEIMFEEELAILALLGPDVKPGEGLLPGSALEEFQAARTFGRRGGECGTAFPLCPFNGTQIMDTVMAYLP